MKMGVGYSSPLGAGHFCSHIRGRVTFTSLSAKHFDLLKTREVLAFPAIECLLLNIWRKALMYLRFRLIRYHGYIADRIAPAGSCSSTLRNLLMFQNVGDSELQ